MCKYVFAILTLAILTGCSNYGTICPPFPKPSQKVLSEIKELNSKDVDEWISNLYKHNLKIKYCRGDFKNGL